MVSQPPASADTTVAVSRSVANARTDALLLSAGCFAIVAGMVSALVLTPLALWLSPFVTVGDYSFEIALRAWTDGLFMLIAAVIAIIATPVGGVLGCVAGPLAAIPAIWIMRRRSVQGQGPSTLLIVSIGSLIGIGAGCVAGAMAGMITGLALPVLTVLTFQ